MCSRTTGTAQRVFCEGAALRRRATGLGATGKVESAQHRRSLGADNTRTTDQTVLQAGRISVRVTVY
eukprot:5532921-Pleurochrysis_carterae.AAC.1